MSRLALFPFIYVVAASANIQAAPAEPSLDQDDRVALVVTSNDLPGPSGKAVNDLSAYLQRTTRAVVGRYPSGAKLAGLNEDAIIVVGAASDPGFADLLHEAGQNLSTQDLGDEGGRLLSVSIGNKPAVLLIGHTWTGACHAVYSFLEQELGIGFFIDGDRVPSLRSVSLAGIDRTEIPRVPIRGLFYHPTWFHPHANCCRLWSFEEWVEYLDWMRHRRLNVLPLFHDDGGYSWGDVLFDAFPQIEKNDTTLAHFVTDPTWRTELNRKIFAYARESGIHIAYNLFYSQVPAFVGDAYPQLEKHPLRMRNVGIELTQPECKELMKQYWGQILKTHGIDDSHIYIVCSYKHEVPLPDYLDSRNAPTMDTIDVIRELDPEANIYVETWCWNYLNEPKTPMPRQEWLDKNALIEWKRFNEEIPPEIGVAEWDRKQEPQRVPDPTFGGRPYIQLTHTMMESWWPPDTIRRHPQWVMDYFNDAMHHGAEGILSFHIQASTNPLLADLTADVCLRKTEIGNYYRDYARRRFGAAVGDVMADSIAAFCDAVNVQPADRPRPVRGSLDDKANFLAFPGFRRSAEEMLERSKTLGDERTAWIKEQLEILQPKAGLAARSALLARSVAPVLGDDPFYQEFLWQLDYVSARVAGIEAIYQSYLVADSDVDESRRLYGRALSAFESVKALFEGNDRYKMSLLQAIEPDVPFTKAFLDDWEFRGELDNDAYSMHVVYERFSLFDEFLRSMRPPQLGPVQPSSLDTRPWFDITK